MSSAEYHPEHDRTSCSDEHPTNVDPEGSTGCARCTAIHLDQGAEAIQHLRALIDSGSVIAGANERSARSAREWLKHIGKEPS